MLSINRILNNPHIPDSVKQDTIDFTDVKLKNGKNAIRVMIDRLLTESEKEEMKKSKKIIGLDCIATYRHAPEIKKSYFYVM